MTSDNSAQIFNGLSDVPGDVQDVDELVEVDTVFDLLSVHALISVHLLF